MTKPKEFLDDDKLKFKPLEVKVGSNFEEAFRRFKSAFQRERIIGQLKEKEGYEKPSEKKRRKSREARERRLMLDARDKMIVSGEWDKRQKRKETKRQQRADAKKKEDNNDNSY